MAKNNRNKKSMQTAFYGKIKERREMGGEWWIGENTQNIHYLSTVATEHKTRQRCIKHLLTAGTADSSEPQVQQACINDGYE